MKKFFFLLAAIQFQTQSCAASPQDEQIRELQRQVIMLAEQMQAIQAQLSRLDMGKGENTSGGSKSHALSNEAKSDFHTEKSEQSATSGTYGTENMFYVGGGFGRTALDITGSKIDSQYIEHGRTNLGNTELNNTDFSYKAFGGYRINNFVSAELGFANLGAYRVKSQVIAPLVPGEFGIKAKVRPRVIFIDAVGFLPLKTKFSLLGKVGLYRGENHINAKTYDTSGFGFVRLRSGSVRDAGYGVKYGAGFQYEIDRDFALRADEPVRNFVCEA